MRSDKSIWITLLVILSLTLSACSFKLRGLEQNSVTTKYSSIYLRGDKDTRLYEELYARLSPLGLPLVEEAKEGTIIISFVGPKFKKSLVAVDSRSQDVEYSITAKSVYYFIDGGIDEKLQKPMRHLSGHTRSHFNKNDEVLASYNEGELIQEALIKQIADDIYIEFLRQ